MTVARNIEAMMARRGCDAAKLARQAGLNPTGIYDILKGKSRSPKIETIAKIAAALEVPVGALFSDVADDELRQDIMFVFESLEPDERRRLLLTAKAWLSDHTA